MRTSHSIPVSRTTPNAPRSLSPHPSGLGLSDPEPSDDLGFFVDSGILFTLSYSLRLGCFQPRCPCSHRYAVFFDVCLAGPPVDPLRFLHDNDPTMTPKLTDKKLAVLGTGKLGGILLRAYLKQGLFSGKRVSSTVHHQEKAAALTQELGVTVSTNNRDAVKEAGIVLLAVKPQVVGDVLKEIKPELGKDALVISVAASVPTSYIEQRVGEKVPVVRVMPNTCSTVGCGMTGICRGSHASPEHLEIAKSLFGAVGRTVVVDEKNMDAVTGLSASGPAFLY